METKRSRTQDRQPVVVHTSDPSVQEAEAGTTLEFEASLVNSSSSRTSKATMRNTISKYKQTKREFQALLGYIADLRPPELYETLSKISDKKNVQ